MLNYGSNIFFNNLYSKIFNSVRAKVKEYHEFKFYIPLIISTRIFNAIINQTCIQFTLQFYRTLVKEEVIES